MNNNNNFDFYNQAHKSFSLISDVLKLTVPPVKPVETKELFSSLPYLTEVVPLEYYNNCFRFKFGSSEREYHIPPERKKNDITSFSINSRRRLKRKLSMVHLGSYSRTFFVTYTFHNVYPKSSDELKRHFRNFLKSVKRVNPSVAWIWRLEWQKRGAPHFHMVYFIPKHSTLKEIKHFEKEQRRLWHRTLEDFDFWTWRYSVDVKSLDSKKKLYAYISKYVSKVENEDDAAIGHQHWGSSANLILKSEGAFHLSQEFFLFFRKQLWKKISVFLQEDSEFYKVFFGSGYLTVEFDSSEFLSFLYLTLSEFERHKSG